MYCFSVLSGDSVLCRIHHNTLAICTKVTSRLYMYVRQLKMPDFRTEFGVRLCVNSSYKVYRGLKPASFTGYSDWSWNDHIALFSSQPYLKILSAYVSNNLATSRKTSFEFSHSVVTAVDTAILVFLVQTKRKVLSHFWVWSLMLMAAMARKVFWVLGVADLSPPE